MLRACYEETASMEFQLIARCAEFHHSDSHVCSLGMWTTDDPLQFGV